MNVIVLYHPQSEHGSQVETYAGDYNRQTGKQLELVSLETLEGADKAKLYDITSYPAVLALKDDGQLLKLWQGETLPLISELTYYDHD